MSTRIKILGHVKQNGQWTKIESDRFDFQAYDSFAIMAGVRDRFNEKDHVKPISPIKGLPLDIQELAENNNSEIVEFLDRYESCRTYLTLKEMLDYPDWNKIATSDDETLPIRDHAANLWHLIEYLSSLPFPPEDIRITFAFDM